MRETRRALRVARLSAPCRIRQCSTSALPTNRLNTMMDDRLSDIFFALSAATRRGVLARLTLSDATVKELAQPYGISLLAVRST
jgi:hypothetical protein